MPDLAFRMRAPLGLTLRDGTRTRIEDWSMRGVTARGLGDRDVSEAVLAIPFQGVVLSFPVYLEPGETPDFYEFRGLNGRQRETLALFYRNLLSGKMATTDEMITALDTPVDLIPMEETAEERAKAGGTRGGRLRRMVTAVVIYTALFALVFGYLGNLAWTRLNEIRLDQPRFIAPIETLSAPMSAIVEQVRYRPGQDVRAGAPLIALTDPETQSKIDQVLFDIRAAERALEEVDMRLAQHELGRAAARQPLEQDLQRALAALSRDDLLAGRNLEALTLAQARLAQFDAGLSLAPRDFNDILSQLRPLQQERQQVLRLLRRERDSYREILAALRVVAPQDGQLVDVLVTQGQYLRAGAPLAVFETDGPRFVRGWLDDRFAAEVYEGMPASIEYNRNGQTERLDGRITRLEAAMNPAEPDRYGMIVSVEAIGYDNEALRALLPTNAPATVKLDRGWLDGWFDGN